MKVTAFIAVGIVLAAVSGSASAADISIAPPIDCGNPFENAYGPYDFRTATEDQRKIVETYHFTPNVESLQSGSGGLLGSDIAYTLRAFPNHVRALSAMVRLGQRDRTQKPNGSLYTVECWVERAVQFRPDDPAVRQIRGIYYSMQRRYDEAIGDFVTVIEQQPQNANAHYNLGLAYFQKGDYDGARTEAKRAAALGFPLKGLTDMLKAKRKWDQ